MNDLISRQDAIDGLMPIYKSAYSRNRNVFSVAKQCMKVLEELPSAQKKGEWIEKKSMIYCSECADEFDSIFRHDYNFCPNCGADMRPDNAPLADDDSIYR